MDIGRAFADPQKEKEGNWVDYREDSKVKIARVGTPNFQRVYESRLKPHRRKQRDGTLSGDVENKILCEVVAETILLDWEGFTNNGKELKYSKKAAFDLLMEHIDFRNEIVELATTESSFYADYVEESEKN